MTPAPFEYEAFRESIQRLGGVVPIDPGDQANVQAAAGALEQLRSIGVGSIARLIKENPRWIPVLGLCVRVSGEQLKGILRHRFGTESLPRLARDHAEEVVRTLDAEFALLEEIRLQRRRRWTFSDVLVERYASRTRAAGSIGRGRKVEDLVQAVAGDLGLPHAMRTRFQGRDATGPCDLAIPEGGQKALIVCAIKGFDSTGSKLTDAAEEIRRMTEIRQPKQFVFAVVDGLGWLRRESDLRRIHELLTKGSLDGLYTLSRLDNFRNDLQAAARRVGLLG